MLSGNRYRAVLEVSSVNFELRSEDEQDALIDTYQSFLNSLACPLQIIVRIREIDIDNYLNDVEDMLSTESEPIYRTQLHNYTAFVKRLVASNKVLTRRFYVVVPSTNQTVDFDIAKQQLNLNCDIVIKGLARIGIRARPLDSLEVLDLFYSFYNPDLAKHQPVTAHTLQLLNSTYLQKGEVDDETSDS